MLIKIIGAVLIIVSCGSVGFRIAAAQRKEETTIAELSVLLDYMECELQYRLTPLPQLCIHTAKQSEGVLRELFQRLACELESQISPDVESCMYVALSKCKSIPTGVSQCLRQLGKTLGSFDVEGQIVGLRATRAACQHKLAQLRLNQDSRLRGYQTLGLCAGISIAVIFI